MALVKLQVRTDTAANWASANPVLLAGEPGHETDTGKVKYGDGVRNWNSLPYGSGVALSASAPPAVGSASTGSSQTAARSDHSHALPSTLAPSSLQVSGNASVGGSLTVTGNLVGGSHTHTASAITDFGKAVETRAADVLKAGTGVSVLHNAVNGTITIASTAQALPTLAGNAGRYLRTDGTSLTWSDVQAVGGAGVTDGDKGDIVVSGSGVTWTLDSSVVSAFARTLLDDSSASQALQTLGAASASHNHDGVYATATHNHDGTYASLVGGKVPASQLPSYVDDVLEYDFTSSFPATGEAGKIYVATSTGITYRWSGTQYVALASGSSGSGPDTTDELQEGQLNLYHTAARAAAAAPVQSVAGRSGAVVLVAGDISAGTLSPDRLPAATASVIGGVRAGTGLSVASGVLSVSYGTTSTTACAGNDARLSDARPAIDGDKGDIVVSNSGASWSIDTTVISSFSRQYLTLQTATAVREQLMAVGSDPAAAGAGAAIDNIVALTQQQFDAISQADASTLYIISDGGTLSISRSAPTQREPLAIVSQPPASISALSGPVSLRVQVTASGTPTYQWQKQEAGSPLWANVANGAQYAGATTDTLTILTLTSNDHLDSYRVVVTVAATDEEAISSASVLVVDSWVFTQQPNDTVSDQAATVTLAQPLSVAVSGDPDGTRFRYRWQYYTIDPTVELQNGRSALGVNMTSSVSADFDKRSLSAITWSALIAASPINGDPSVIQNEAGDVVGAEDYAIWLRCRVQDFWASPLSPPTRYSNYAKLVIRRGPPAIVTQPSGTQISATGTASFYVEYDSPGVVEWRRVSPSGIDSPALLQGSAQYSENSGVFRSTLTLSGLTGNDAGSGYYARITSSRGSVSSQLARLTAAAPRFTRAPQHTTVLTGETVTLSAAYTYAGIGETVSWQRRDPNTDAWSAVSGASSTTLTFVATGDDNGDEFRVAVFADGVYTYSLGAIVTVVSTQDLSDPAYAQQLRDATIELNGSYTAEATSTLLTGVNQLSHYAVLSVEYDDGTFALHPLANGIRTGAHGETLNTLRYFPAGTYTTYRVNILLSKNAKVRLWIATNPYQATSQPTTGATGTKSPFLRKQYSAWVYGEAGAASVGYYTYSANEYTGFQTPYPPYGFAGSQSARVTVLPRRPFYGPAVRGGLWFPPQSYYFSGASLANGTCVFVPVSNPFWSSSSDALSHNTYLISYDEGGTWSTFQFPVPLRPKQVLNFRGAFYVMHPHPSGYHSALTSTDGRAWTWTGWNFGACAATAEPLTACAANGRLFVRTSPSTLWSWSGTGTAVSASLPSLGSYPVYDGLRLLYTQQVYPQNSSPVQYVHGQYVMGHLYSADGRAWFPAGTASWRRVRVRNAATNLFEDGPEYYIEPFSAAPVNFVRQVYGETLAPRTLAGNTTNQSTTLTIASTQNLQAISAFTSAQWRVTGSGIQSDTFVTAIASGSVTLSKAATATASNVNFVFDANVVKVGNADLLAQTWTASGPGIPADATVVGVNENTLTLSAYTTSASGYGLFTFENASQNYTILNLGQEWAMGVSGSVQAGRTTLTGLSQTLSPQMGSEVCVQVGQYMYGQAAIPTLSTQTYDYSLQRYTYASASYALMRVQVGSPRTYEILASLPEYSQVSSRWDDGTVSDVYIGGYRYGLTGQDGQPAELPSRYLNGLDTPASLDVCFTKSKILKVFRYAPPSSGGTTGTGTVRLPPRR